MTHNFRILPLPKFPPPEIGFCYPTLSGNVQVIIGFTPHGNALTVLIDPDTSRVVQVLNEMCGMRHRTLIGRCEFSIEPTAIYEGPNTWSPIL